ncbi:MAG: tyrosine-type recombinase/integrase [Defluviitaleaceae bacterium]|nr:tyrosine-type recombinase/integrase [Defluviitaleaceae bacterium]
MSYVDDNIVQRHTFATRGLENGIDIKVMQELLGHSSIKMTADTYTHVLPSKKRDSILKLTDTIKL